MDFNFLHNELNRVTDWISHAETKAAFATPLYIGFIGFFITQREEIIYFVKNGENYVNFFIVALVASVIFWICGFLNIYLTIFPITSRKDKKSSLFYFGSVSKMKLDIFSRKIKGLNDDQLCEELIEQIHTNSSIADRKIICIKKGIKYLFLLFASCLILAFFLFK